MPWVRKMHRMNEIALHRVTHSVRAATIVRVSDTVPLGTRTAFDGRR